MCRKDLKGQGWRQRERERSRKVGEFEREKKKSPASFYLLKLTSYNSSLINARGKKLARNHTDDPALSSTRGH